MCLLEVIPTEYSLLPSSKYNLTLSNEQVEIINNLPVYTGWKVGKLVQRAHIVKEEKINSKLCI